MIKWNRCERCGEVAEYKERFCTRCKLIISQRKKTQTILKKNK